MYNAELDWVYPWVGSGLVGFGLENNDLSWVGLGCVEFSKLNFFKTPILQILQIQVDFYIIKLNVIWMHNSVAIVTWVSLLV